MKIQNYALLLLLIFFGCKKNDPIVEAKSSEKKIIAFKFTSTSPESIGVIDETNKKITVSVPYGTVLTTLIPSITISDKATISTPSADFSKIVAYKVTAQDGTVQEYQVTTNISNPKFTLDAYVGPTELNAGSGYLLIKGKNFGTDASKIKVVLNNKIILGSVTVTNFVVVDDNSIGLIIPESVPHSYHYGVYVSIDNQTIELPGNFFITPPLPVVTSLNKTSFLPAEVLTINGRNFTSTSLAIIKNKATAVEYWFSFDDQKISITSTKMELKVFFVPPGEYTLEVKQAGKSLGIYSQTIQLLPPPANKPLLYYTEKTTFAQGEIIKFNGFNLLRPGVAANLNFVPVGGGVTYTRSATQLPNETTNYYGYDVQWISLNFLQISLRVHIMYL